jgi:hypothetical protein
VLQSFPNDSSLETIGSFSLFKENLLINIPQLKIYNQSMSKIIANDKQEKH